MTQTPDSPAAPEASHPFAAALRDAGYEPADASSLLDRAKLLGQVSFEHDPGCKERAGRMRGGRDALLASIAAKNDVYATGAAVFTGVFRPTEADLVGHGKYKAASTAFKKKSMANCWELDGLAGWLQTGPTRDEIIEFAVGSPGRHGAKAAPESWERVDRMARAQSSPTPLRSGGEALDDFAGSMEPAGLEAEFQGRAQALLSRFNLGGVRFMGMPGRARVGAGLDSLEASLEALADASGLPDKAIGLDGAWSVNIGVDMPESSGLCNRSLRQINLGRDGGWGALAHEWFHAIDGMAGDLRSGGALFQTALAGNAVDGALPEPTTPEGALIVASFIANTGGAPGAGDEFAALDRSSLALMKAIKTADGARAVKTILDDTREECVQRMVEGVILRGAKSIPFAIDAAEAESSFRILAGDILDGAAGPAELKAWREKAYGAAAPRRAIWDAVLLAEKSIRDQKAADALATARPSIMQAYAAALDQAITGRLPGLKEKWKGYFNNPLEMSARAFEGNCFEHLSPATADLLVHRERSLAWPQGAERGAHAQAFKDFLRAAASALVQAKILPEEASPAEPARAAAPAEPSSILSKLDSRRAAANQPDVLIAAKPKAP